MGGLGLGLGILGGTSLLGGLLGSKAASSQADASNQAAREARQLYDDRTLEAQARQYKMLFGGNAASRLKSDYGPDAYARLFGTPGTPAQQINPGGGDPSAINAQLKSLLDKYGGNVRIQNGQLVGSGGVPREDIQRIQNLLGQQGLMQQANGRPIDVPAVEGTKGFFNEADFSSGGPGILDQYRQLAGDAESRGSAVLSDLDQRNAALQSLLAEHDRRLGGLDDRAIQETRQYGGARMSEIDRDAQRAIEQANRAASGRARAAGLGGSSLTRAIGENTRGIFERAQSAKNAVGDTRTQMLAGLYDNAAGRAGQRSSQMMGYRAAGDAQAVSGRQAMNQYTDSLRRQPLDLELQTLTGPAFNPYLGQDTTRFVPQLSPGAAGMSAWGNSLGQFGSMLGLYAMGGGFNGPGGGGVNNSLNALTGRNQFSPFLSMATQ